MALTYTAVKDYVNVSIGNFRASLFDVALDTSYPTGGYAIAASAVGLRTILAAEPKGGNPAAKVLMYWWDTTNGKLMCVFPSGGGAAAPTSLADPVGSYTSTGATAIDGTTGTISITETPGQGKEVGATANLSTITVRMLFLGN